MTPTAPSSNNKKNQRALEAIADLSTKLATCLKSSSVKPLDVRAGAPMRTPPGIRADVSPAHSTSLSAPLLLLQL